jgi:hypothetical protein
MWHVNERNLILSLNGSEQRKTKRSAPIDEPGNPDVVDTRYKRVLVNSLRWRRFTTHSTMGQYWSGSGRRAPLKMPVNSI